MKKTSILLAFVLTSLLTFAQGAAPLSKGEKQLNFGLGFGNGIPAYIGADFAVHDDITVGPEISVNLDGMNYMTFAGRGDYHWNRLIGIPSNWDFYTGMNLGFALGFNGYGSDLSLGAQIGGRYYWTDKWAINLEFAGGTVDVGGKIGVSMKF